MTVPLVLLMGIFASRFKLAAVETAMNTLKIIML